MKIHEQSAKMLIVGGSYVGLPRAAQCAKNSHHTTRLQDSPKHLQTRISSSLSPPPNTLIPKTPSSVPT